MMSNALRYDSLLVHYLAAELGDRLRRRRLIGLALDPERRRVVFDLDDFALTWDLHPTAGWLVEGRAEISPAPVKLMRRTEITAVWAPRDERTLIFDLRGAARASGRPTRLVAELQGNQWNFIAIGPDERIIAILWRRRAGIRELRPGQRYEPPPPMQRMGATRPLGLEEWRDRLGDLAPAERARALINTVAYMSPLNVGPILGAAAIEPATPAPLDEAHTRYLLLASLPPAQPRILELGGTRQPYPLPLPGVDDVPYPTLLAAMATLTGADSVTGAPATVPLDLLDRARQWLGRLERRGGRLAAELEAAEEGARLHRRQADLLMSQLHLARKGAPEVTLTDWEGGTVVVALDPALSPQENAARLYDQARREDRAAERLPPLIEGLDRERQLLTRLLREAEGGDLEAAAELDALLPRAEEGPSGTSQRTAAPLPYRRYRTSGGYEVRVGRSSRANDELTFRHSSPNDIWLHARDTAGAHVILRWGSADSTPPARDLAEAATLAALHSRARGSGLVAVDWTRRKYVRKPRKSGPGLVAFERGRTLFVEPDEALERRLRDGDQLATGD